MTCLIGEVLDGPGMKGRFFLKIGIQRAKVYTKNVPNIEVCDFIPGPSRTSPIKQVIVVLYLQGGYIYAAVCISNLRLSLRLLCILIINIWIVVIFSCTYSSNLLLTQVQNTTIGPAFNFTDRFLLSRNVVLFCEYNQWLVSIILQIYESKKVKNRNWNINYNF